MHNQVFLETVNKLFIAVDDRKWDQARSRFCDTVLLDYTSMTGGEPISLASDQIIESWKGILPGFDKTHHQLGNYIVESNSEMAKVFCYGTATHYLANHSGRNLWTVVGSYEIELKNIHNEYRISKMKFELKYIDGNNDLPKLAQEKVKQTPKNTYQA